MSQQGARYTFVQGYRQNAERRLAFNRLAGQVFGLDFEPWFQRGFWTDSYLPFTLFDGDIAIANASANRFTLVINGQRRRAVQFGTVMTHPDYRGQGLASRLMREAMETLLPECDFFYLMGDKDALGFYRKLGFEAVPQVTYQLNGANAKVASDSQPPETELPLWCKPSAGTGRWLNMDDPEDCRILLNMADAREPVSLRAGVLDARHLLAFYALNGYGDKLWYIGDDTSEASAQADARLAIFEAAEGVLQLHDVLFQTPAALADLLPLLPHGQLAGVQFGFAPDRMGLRPEDGTLQVQPLVSEDVFFVMSVAMSEAANTLESGYAEPDASASGDGNASKGDTSKGDTSNGDAVDAVLSDIGPFGPEPFLYPPIGLA